MRVEADCCCFCRQAVPWDEQVRVVRRGRQRVAHTRCCIGLKGGEIARMAPADRDRVLAAGYRALLPDRPRLGLTPRRFGRAGGG